MTIHVPDPGIPGLTHHIHGVTVRPDPEPAMLRAPLPPLRRVTDRAPFEQPAFWSALGATLDHVQDEAKREGHPPILTFAEIEQLCRLFLTHYIALGGRL